MFTSACRLFFLFDTIFFVELINTSARLCRFLLSCVERMAFGTDFHMDTLVGRACNECVPAVASHSCLMVLRMDSFSHVFHLSIFKIFIILSKTTLLLYHTVQAFARDFLRFPSVFFFFLKELLPDDHPGQFVVVFCP